MRGGGGGRGGGFDGFRDNRYVWCGCATLVYSLWWKHVLTVDYCLLFLFFPAPFFLPFPLFLRAEGVMVGDKAHHRIACESASHLKEEEKEGLMFALNL